MCIDYILVCVLQLKIWIKIKCITIWIHMIQNMFCVLFIWFVSRNSQTVTNSPVRAFDTSSDSVLVKWPDPFWLHIFTPAQLEHTLTKFHIILTNDFSVSWKIFCVESAIYFEIYSTNASNLTQPKSVSTSNTTGMRVFLTQAISTIKMVDNISSYMKKMWQESQLQLITFHDLWSLHHLHFSCSPKDLFLGLVLSGASAV